MQQGKAEQIRKFADQRGISLANQYISIRMGDKTVVCLITEHTKGKRLKVVLMSPPPMGVAAHNIPINTTNGELYDNANIALSAPIPSRRTDDKAPNSPVRPAQIKKKRRGLIW